MSGLGSGPGSGPSESKHGGPQWWLLAVVALGLAVVVLSVPAWLRSGPTIPPRSVHDAAFVRRADAVCATALPKLRDARPLSRDNNGTPAAFAARIEKAAVGLEAVDRQLRGVPVKAGTDATEVDRWLGDWESYTAVGHRYAAAIRAQDKTRWEALSNDGQVIAKRIFVFSKANDMPDCQF